MGSDVLRVYDPVECDEYGVPLDWEQCRTCEGRGHHFPESVTACGACDGHGSLKAAALARAVFPQVNEVLRRVYDEQGPIEERLERLGPAGTVEHIGRTAREVREKHVPRCEGCDHPMSEGRPVDVRTLGWAHDLRPERLSVLCLRCWGGGGWWSCE